MFVREWHLEETRKEKRMKKQQVVRQIESSPIRQEDGNWVVHFAENGEHIGIVQVFDGYTKSGWSDDANITDDVRFRCEDHAVEQYKAVMVERVCQMLLSQMSTGSSVVVIPFEKKTAL